MPVLARKIERAKWAQNAAAEADQVSADAITSCRTMQNALSVWEVAGSEDLETAVLAITTGFDRLDAIDVVMLPSEAVVAAGLQIEQTDGRTPVLDLVQTHRGLANLTYRSLGTVANLVLGSLAQNMWKRYSLAEIRKIINDAINAGRLEKEQLQERVRDRL